MTAPPLAVSSQSKSKLSAFAFAAGDGPQESRPEQAGGLARGDSKQQRQDSKGNCDQNGASKVSHESQDSPTTLPKAPPQTPAARLPLAELMANPEENAARLAAQDASPEERVFWEHTRSSGSSNRTSFVNIPGGQRVRKRARSSSPAPSPQGDSTRAPGGKTTFDLQPLQESLRTPRANPADDLWNRYAVEHGAKPSACGPVNPTFAHLLNSSSPRSDVNAAAVPAGLRRAASCGTEWPTSKSKKRKLSQPSLADAADHLVAAPKQDQSPSQGRSKLSRVSLLVERVQESLARPSKADGSAGTSSLIASPQRHERPATAPLPNDPGTTSATAVAPCSPKCSPRHPGAPVDAVPSQHDSDAKGDSSDFGEFDDLDLKLLETVDRREDANKESPGLKNQGSVRHVTREEDNSNLALAAIEPVVKPCHARAHQSSPRASLANPVTRPPDGTVDSDEFGDDDEDLDAADFENVVAQYDTGPSSLDASGGGGRGGAAPTQAQKLAADEVLIRSVQARDLKPSSRLAIEAEEGDDEFGDVADFDFDLAAAEVAASHPPSSTSVCIGR